MIRATFATHALWRNRWTPTALFAVALLAMGLVPTALAPVARAIYAVCERLPLLSPITGHTPPLFLAFAVVVAAALLASGARAALFGLVATIRFNREIDRQASASPARLQAAGDHLRIGDRLVFLDRPEAMAFCYGLLAPRIGVTAGLLSLLNDAELLAVLAHEQEHLRRRDPLRYLLIDTLAAMAAVVPIAGVLRARVETRIEVAADQAALRAAPRPALAGALLAVLSAPSPAVPGLAGLSATEARIAHLAGQSVLPPLPHLALAATLALAAIFAGVGAHLALSAYHVGSTCLRCIGAL
jgi:Zn-dependent protease with chaperone function